MLTREINTKRRTCCFLLIALFTAALLTGCNEETEVEVDANMLMTQVMSTINAEMTQTAAAKPTFTATIPPTVTKATTPTTQSTKLSAGIPASSGVSYSAVTTTSCNQAEFISDVTIADGTSIEPGVTFTKTWSLSNAGTCSWTTDYLLVYYSGSQMDGPDSQDLTDTTITPGDSIEISVELIAPTTAGTYTGYWALQSADGETFGIGSVAQPFYVQIVVGTSSTETPTFTSTSEYTATAAYTSTPTSTSVPPTDTPVPTNDTSGGSSDGTSGEETS